jgi:hypothetical protein
MASITDADVAGTCDTCGTGADDLEWRAGDNVCRQCNALFTTAHALLNNGISDEAAILGTLAFAWSEAAWLTPSDNYGGLEFLGVADRVPVLKLPDITTDVVTHDGSCIPRAVKITVHSRHVEQQRVAETYQELLENHKIHYDTCSAGSVAWDMEHASLTLTIRAMRELHPGRVSHFETYPPGRVYAFPPPMLIGGFYSTLLGSNDKRALSGYAHALAGSGQHTPQKAVAGSVAWLLGEKKNNTTPPKERRPSIAKRLNKHLLVPRGEPTLPEDYWTPDDTVWRDAASLGPRLMRVLYHIQENR